jgi:hypothetical protein
VGYIDIALGLLLIPGMVFVAYLSWMTKADIHMIIEETMAREIRLQDDRLRKKYEKTAEDSRNDTGTSAERGPGVIGQPYRG